MKTLVEAVRDALILCAAFIPVCVVCFYLACQDEEEEEFCL